jgi:hypothetical protein
MIWALAFYWIVTGLALWRISPHDDIVEFIICMLLGGVLTPAQIISKALT